MITASTRRRPELQGLLLLDCWEPQVPEHLFKEKFYINLIEQIALKQGHTQFEWIVNSASRLQINLSDACMANTMKLCEYNDNHPIVRNLLQEAGVEKTSTLISRYLFKKQTINIINDTDFVWFCVDYLLNQTKNWLVAGHTWQLCTHSHALGLPTLARLTKTYPLNFYVTDYSFCTMTEQTATLKDFEQDSMNWCLIEDFGYQLLPSV